MHLKAGIASFVARPAARSECSATQVANRLPNRSACERVVLWIWIQRPIEAQAPSTRDRDGYFWVIWRIDDVANVSGDRLSTAVVESAIVARGQGRGGGRDRLTEDSGPGDLRAHYSGMRRRRR